MNKSIVLAFLIFGMSLPLTAQTFNLIPPSPANCGAYSTVSCVVTTPRGTSLMIDFDGKERHSIHVIDAGKMASGDDNVTGTFTDNKTTAMLLLTFKRGTMTLNFDYHVSRTGFRALFLTSGTVNLVTP